MSKGSQARLSYVFAHFFVAWLNQFAVRKFDKIGSSQALKRPSVWRRSILEARSRTDVQKLL